MKITQDQAKVVCTNEFLRMLVKGNPFSMQEAFQPPSKPSEVDHSVYVDVFKKKQWKQSVIDRVQKLGLLDVDHTKDRMFMGMLSEEVRELFAGMLVDGDTSVAKWLLFPNDYEPPEDLVGLVPALQQAAPGAPVDEAVEAHVLRGINAVDMLTGVKGDEGLDGPRKDRDELTTMQSMLTAIQHILETQKLIAESLKSIDAELSKRPPPVADKPMPTAAVTQVFRTIVDSAATALNKRLEMTETRINDRMLRTYERSTEMITAVNNYVKQLNVKDMLQQYLSSMRNEEWRTSKILQVIATQSERQSGEVIAALELLIEKEKDGEKNTG